MRVRRVHGTPYFDLSASSESKLRMCAAGDELAPPRAATPPYGRWRRQQVRSHNDPCSLIVTTSVVED